MDNKGPEKHNVQSDEVKIIVRRGCMNDLNFIYATWLNGYYFGSKDIQAIHKPTFMLEYHKVIENILSKPSTQVAVAALKDDEDVIIGYSVFEEPVLHWVFVKDGWRKMGVGKTLTNLPFKICTHQTYKGQKVWPKLIFDPFLLQKL